MKLHDVILQSSEAALELIDPETGSLPAGHNGPYHDAETPVRNTSHWLITFLKAYQISSQTKFIAAAHEAADYLSSSSARPMQATFWHRRVPSKDTCNGLVGQAWTIEALVEASQILERPELLDLAKEVFLLHPFSQQLGLWRRVSVDGTYLTFDMTLNHQIWFAASGALLARHVKGEVEDKVTCYLDRLKHNLEVYPSGLIRHLASISLFSASQQARFLLTERWRQSSKARKYSHRKAIGYHAFNLYALALLRQVFPNHHIWQDKKIQSALRYLQTPDYALGLEGNKYGYPYNPPGFEVSFALDVFGLNDRAIQEKWVSQQLQACYNADSRLMTLNTEDSATHAARLYESTRLSDLNISLPDTVAQKAIL